MTDIGHSSVLKKKASGTRDMQPSVVAIGISVLHKCWRNSTILDTQLKSGRNTVHFTGEFDKIDLMYRTVHATNHLCIYGAVTMSCVEQYGTDSGEPSRSRPESARNTPRDAAAFGKFRIDAVNEQK